MRRWGTFSLIVLLAGCAGDHTLPPPQSYPPPNQAGDQASEPQPEPGAQSAQTPQNGSDLQIVLQECATSMQTPRLDPIRDKVELVRQANLPIPPTILANHNYPTAAEREAIAVWGTLDDQCQQHIAAWEQTRIAAAEGADRQLVIHLVAYVTTGFQLENELRDVLHQGKLTYSVYAKARQAIADEGRQAAARYAAAARAGDGQAMAAADAGYGHDVAAAQAFMEKVVQGAAGEARAGGTPPANGAGMMEPPPIGANRPQPPAGANGMMEPPPIGGSGHQD